MSDTPTENILMVYVGKRISDDKLADYWIVVTPEQFERAELSNETRSYNGKTSKQYLATHPGQVFEVPQEIGGTSIYPANAKVLGLWKDDAQRTSWQAEHRMNITTFDLRRKGKKEGTADNFAVLLPFREMYRKQISQDRRAALLAQMIAFVTR